MREPALSRDPVVRRLSRSKAFESTGRRSPGDRSGKRIPCAVSPGQTVKSGEVLAVIEAMKMENTLRAERDTVVREVLAEPGNTLEVDQPIIAFEPAG